MKANLNLTPFVPNDFPKQTLRSHAGININHAGKFSINKNGKDLTEFAAGDKVVMFQNEEPHTAIWFIKKDSSGWPLKDHDSVGLHFSAKYLAKTIFESFGVEDETASFSFFLHDEPLEMNGEKYWILFSEDSFLNDFVASLKQDKPHINGTEVHHKKRGPKPGSKRKRKPESIYDGGIS